LDQFASLRLRGDEQKEQTIVATGDLIIAGCDEH